MYGRVFDFTKSSPTVLLLVRVVVVWLGQKKVGIGIKKNKNKIKL